MDAECRTCEWYLMWNLKSIVTGDCWHPMHSEEDVMPDNSCRDHQPRKDDE